MDGFLHTTLFLVFGDGGLDVFKLLHRFPQRPLSFFSMQSKSHNAVFIKLNMLQVNSMLFVFVCHKILPLMEVDRRPHCSLQNLQ